MTSASTPHEDRTRTAAELAYRSLLCLTAVSDALPARWRFGHWQSVLALLSTRDALPAIERDVRAGRPGLSDAVPVIPAPKLTALLVTGALDGGGVENVVSALATGLAQQAISIELICTKWGRVADDLSRAGVPVTAAPAARLAELVASRRPDVIQLHRPDTALLGALVDVPVPVVPVFHAMESYLARSTWTLLSTLARRAPTCVAVSERVRSFFAERLGGASIRVVVNGVPEQADVGGIEHARARAAVGQAVGARIADSDILVVALQRFGDQKNPAGLVDAFLQAADVEPRLRLVMAGGPDNWLEFRRADMLRRAHPRGRRVHLLGDSDPSVMLAAGDLYALDSFAEGGPSSAVEAAAHGLPLVLSDVGFVRELLDAETVRGEWVRRANHDFSQASLAAQRRRRNQDNRDEFVAALLRVAQLPRNPIGVVPEPFREAAMIRGHAEALMAAVG